MKPFLAAMAIATLAAAEPKPLSESQQLAAARQAIKVLQAQAARLATELQRVDAGRREEAEAAAYRALAAKLAAEAGAAEGCTLDGEQKWVCPEVEGAKP